MNTKPPFLTSHEIALFFICVVPTVEPVRWGCMYSCMYVHACKHCIKTSILTHVCTRQTVFEVSLSMKLNMQLKDKMIFTSFALNATIIKRVRIEISPLYL